MILRPGQVSLPAADIFELSDLLKLYKLKLNAVFKSVSQFAKLVMIVCVCVDLCVSPPFYSVSV